VSSKPEEEEEEKQGGPEDSKDEISEILGSKRVNRFCDHYF